VDSFWPKAPWLQPDGGTNYAEAFLKYMLKGGNPAAIAADLTARYNAALDLEQSKGLEVKRIPDFDPAKPMGR